MPVQKPRPRVTPVATDPEAIARYRLMDAAIRRGSYQIDELESALGMYMVGFHYGWKVLYMVHSKRTIRKYEELLQIKVAVGVNNNVAVMDADKTNAYMVIMAASNFWKAVSGEDKPLGAINKRALIDKEI